jgi:uncharacterized RDD family membrane protein YckC
MIIQNEFLKKRMLAMVVDHFSMTFLMMIAFLPASVAFRIANPATVGSPFTRLQDSPYFFSYAALLISFYLNKDLVNGRSIAKRFLNFQVVEFKSGKPASPFKCLIRNLTAILWPLEVVAVALRPSRRIGDLLARTKVIEVERGRLNRNAPQNLIQSVGLVSTIWVAILIITYLI